MISFNGIDQYAHADPCNVGTTVTVEFYMMFKDPNVDTITFFGVSMPPPWTNFFATAKCTGDPMQSCAIGPHGTSNWQGAHTTDSSKMLATDSKELHHVAFTNNGGNAWSFFLDGHRLSTYDNQGSNTNYEHDDNIYFATGYSLGGWTQFGNLYLQHIRVSSTVRYTTDFTPSLSTFTTDDSFTTARWDASDASDGDTTLTDASGNGKTLTLHGSPQIVSVDSVRGYPSSSPSAQPSSLPSAQPSAQPSSAPTSAPSLGETTGDLTVIAMVGVLLAIVVGVLGGLLFVRYYKSKGQKSAAVAPDPVDDKKGLPVSPSSSSGNVGRVAPSPENTQKGYETLTVRAL
jgi:hypothetical protein